MSAATEIQKARLAVLGKVLKLEDVDNILRNEGFNGLNRRLNAAGVSSKEVKAEGDGAAAPAEAPTENEALAMIAKMVDEMIGSGASLEKSYADLKGLFESKMSEIEAKMAATEAKAEEAVEEAKALKAENATLKGRLEKAEAALALKPKGFREWDSSGRVGEQLKQEGQVAKQVTQFGDFTIEE